MSGLDAPVSPAAAPAPAADPRLAGRGERFRAFLVDALLGAIFYALMKYQPFGLLAAALGAVGFVALLIGQWVLLATQGQTVGKKLVGLRIVRLDTGNNGGFTTNVLLRTWLNGVLCLIPLYFLADSLFVYREDRRCLHDLIAGTMVVKA